MHAVASHLTARQLNAHNRAMAQSVPSEPVDLSDWDPVVSGNAELKLSTVLAGRAPALRMEYDFKGGKGFVVARRKLSRPMPAEYAVHFRLRGRGGVNNLELKLIDATGRNVWRYVEKDLKLPARWKRMSSAEPGYRVCVGSGERQQSVSTRFPGVRHRCG